MKRSVLLTLGLALLVGAVAFAQAKPDFSGTWTPDPSAAPAGGGGRGGGMGGPMKVTQTANELTVERTMGENAIKLVYKLDGTESVNEMMGRGGMMKQASVAKWDGAKLLITTKMEGPQGPTDRTQTWYLEGGNLVIEQPGGRDAAIRKTVYKKG